MTRDLVSLLRQSADQCPDTSPTLVAAGIRQGMLMHRRRRRAVLIGAAAGVAAAVAFGILAINWPGDGSSETEPVGEETTAPVATDEDVLVSCGGDEGWPPSVMSEGVPGLLDEAEATATFQAILDDPQLSQEAELSILSEGADVEWRVLRGDEDSLTLGLGHWTEEGPAGAGAYVLDLEREGEHWTTAGWGDCNLAPVLAEGSTWARVSSYHATGQDATTLQAEVTENQCTSGRDPGPFLHEPTIVEDEESVTIYWTTTPHEGAANCQGNPSVTRDIQLADSLGDRKVLDGSQFPPRPVNAN